MTRVAAAAIALTVALGVAHADPDADASRAFRDALARGDIDALEQLGSLRPVTRWTDDAWSEAARLAVRMDDVARARRDLEQVIAISTDAQLVRRARAELARIAEASGKAGEWSAIASAHERLVPALHAGGDPRPALRELERLLGMYPAYPRAAMLMVALAGGWEREGEAERALDWLRRSGARATTPIDRLRAHAELVRTLTRTGELATATEQLAVLARAAPPGLIGKLRKDLDRAELRRTARWVMRVVLALIAALAAFSLRRTTGAWRAAARRLVRPPAEAVFIVPIAIVLVVVAYAGNPLIARAVLAIALAGVVSSWVSGAILDGHRGRVALCRALAHAGLALLAVAAIAYLAVDSGHLIDFVLETWRAGHERG